MSILIYTLASIESIAGDIADTFCSCYHNIGIVIDIF